MTEITAKHEIFSPVRPLPFLFALIVAPLTIGTPSLVIIFLLEFFQIPGSAGTSILSIPLAATILGAPTYLLLGGPASWTALRKGYSIALTAFVINLLSLPFVVLGLWLFGYPPWATLILFGLFGSIFAPLWGAIFEVLYIFLTKEPSHV